MVNYKQFFTTTAVICLVGAFFAIIGFSVAEDIYEYERKSK